MTSEGRRRRIAAKALDDPLADLRWSDLGGPAVAEDLQEAGLEDEIVVAVPAVGEVLGDFLPFGGRELLVEEGVKLFDAVVTVHRDSPHSARGAVRSAAIPRSRARSYRRCWRNFRPRCRRDLAVR